MYSFSKSSNDCSLALFCGGGGGEDVSAGFGGGGAFCVEDALVPVPGVRKVLSRG